MASRNSSAMLAIGNVLKMPAALVRFMALFFEIKIKKHLYRKHNISNENLVSVCINDIAKVKRVNF